MLNVNNFKGWKENILIVLGCMDINLAVSTKQLVPLNDKIPLRKIETFQKWERLNCLSLMIMKHGIPETFSGSEVDQVTSAKEFLTEIEKQFLKNDKVEICTILSNLISMRHKGKWNIKEYIMKMSLLVSKLKALWLELANDLFIHLV